MGDKNAETLTHTMWYFTTKLLGFRGSNRARQLTWGDFQIVEEDGVVQYIQWRERSTNTRSGDNPVQESLVRPFAPNLFPNLNDPTNALSVYLKYSSLNDPLKC